MYNHKRKKRRSTGVYRVDLQRGQNGFGFSISSEKPCILSCIVPDSPAFGLLKAGDYLMSVKDLDNDGPETNITNVCHEKVVDLIASSTGKIRLTVAGRHYFANSSDEDSNQYKYNQNARHLRHTSRNDQSHLEKRLMENVNFFVAKNSKKVNNQDSKVRSFSGNSEEFLLDRSFQNSSLEYRVVVGYLGTIEMPKQIAAGSKHNIVKGCIRKIKQERRAPNTVLMTILPSCLSLTNKENVVLANYPASRLNYASNSSENNSKYFALVTSAIYADGLMCDTTEIIPPVNDISVSNSCHIFVVDTKLVDHSAHIQLSDLFGLQCTSDQITGLCLEYPKSSDYVVDLIKSMYYKRNQKFLIDTLDTNSSGVQLRARQNQLDQNSPRSVNIEHRIENNISPQLSNHSEVTTNSSNSDSGIGVYNDCTNISDRILVVDFPKISENELLQFSRNKSVTSSMPSRPIGIIHEVPTNDILNDVTNIKSVTYQTNATHSLKPATSFHERAIDVPEDILDYARFTINNAKIYNNSARSCNDLVAKTFGCNDQDFKNLSNKQTSYDNILEYMASTCFDNKKGGFALPKPIRKVNKSSTLPSKQCTEYNLRKVEQLQHTDKLSSYKLSPKVFGLPRPISISFENLSLDVSNAQKKNLNTKTLTNWNSLKELNDIEEVNYGTQTLMEGIASEPNLAIPRKERNPDHDDTPFHRRNQASFRSLSDRPKPENTATRKNNNLLISPEKNICRQSFESLDSFTNSTQGPSVWANSFEKMLDDTQGIHVFAEFLKKEISAENIYFWAACERYKQITQPDRLKEARNIFEMYLSSNASDPINIDSKTRSITEEKLLSAEPDLFEMAQKHIFNLMKFDSYPRFLKSDIYKMCIEAEQKKLKVPYPGYKMDPLLKFDEKPCTSTKIKKSYSNAEDRRKTSLLPWHRKTRSQSKDRLKDSKHELKDQSQSISSSKNSITDITGSNNSLIFNLDTVMAQNFEASSCHGLLCRIVLPDGANSINHVKDEPIKEFVSRILEKRGVNFLDFEVFYCNGNSKALDLTASALTLAHKEIKIEQRVLFKMDLPNKKVISVKSKANKLLFEVLKPILNKYNYQLEDIQTFTKEKMNIPVDISLPVTSIEGQRLQILYKYCDDYGYRAITTKADNSSNLDEITNKVFNEVLQGKIDSNIGTLSQNTENSSIKSEDFKSEASSHKILPLLSHFPISAYRITKQSSKKHVHETPKFQEDNKKPLIAKLKAGVKIQVPGITHGEELLEEIKKAQRRIDDQRGTQINFDLPEFLKDKKNLTEDSISQENGNSSILPFDTLKPQPAPRLSISLSNMNTSVHARVQNYENILNSNDGLSLPHYIDQNSDSSFSDTGNTTLVVQHTKDNLDLLNRESLNSDVAPPLPPKPKIRQAVSNSINKPQYSHIPNGTFI